MSLPGRLYVRSRNSSVLLKSTHFYLAANEFSSSKKGKNLSTNMFVHPFFGRFFFFLLCDSEFRFLVFQLYRTYNWFYVNVINCCRERWRSSRIS